MQANGGKKKEADGGKKQNKTLTWMKSMTSWLTALCPCWENRETRWVLSGRAPNLGDGDGDGEEA
jgi:hypothetical protein